MLCILNIKQTNQVYLSTAITQVQLCSFLHSGAPAGQSSWAREPTGPMSGGQVKSDWWQGLDQGQTDSYWRKLDQNQKDSYLRALMNNYWQREGDRY